MIPWDTVAMKLDFAAHNLRGAQAIAGMMKRFSYRNWEGKLCIYNAFFWFNGNMKARGCREMRGYAHRAHRAHRALRATIAAAAIVRGCAAYQQGRAA